MSASNYVKLVPGNVHTDWTSEIILARGEDGEVTKSVQVGVPTQLSADEKEKVESLGYTLESSSKAEAEEHKTAMENAAVGGDIVGSGPLLGDDTGEPDQHVNTSNSDDK